MAALQDLFSKSNAQFSSANTSLRYQDKSVEALKHSEEMNPTNNGPVIASVVILYRYQNSNPIDLGKKGAAIVPNKEKENGSYCLICYEIKKRDLLFSIKIDSHFIPNVLSNNFISFYDSKSNYFALRLPNHDLLQQFVTSLVMTKIPKLAHFNSSRNIIIQDLNETPSPSDSDSDSHCSVVCDLQIWLCDIKYHPYKTGQIVFDSQKTLSLNDPAILPALSLALNSKQKIKINSKKLIICSSHYGFGPKGNKTLNIPPNASLMIKCTVKSFVEHRDNNSDNVNESTKQRMARLSAATGGALLATLIGNDDDIPLATSMDPEGQIRPHEPPVPVPVPVPVQMQMPIQIPMKEPAPQHSYNHNDKIYSKLNDIWLELNNLCHKPIAQVLSCGDIIKCLNELNADWSHGKTEINSQKVEIERLKEENNALKSRNHELLEKNNRLMEQQYQSMSSSHDESLRLRKENIEFENSILILKQNNARLQSQNECMKQQLTECTTNLNECKLELTSKEDAIAQYIKDCELKQNEINALNVKLKHDSKLQEENTRLAANYKSISLQLAQSKHESKEIFNESKKRIENLKRKFEMHRINLIKRIMQFVYTEYDDNIKGNENNFNYISFFRHTTKQILANPNDFDEEEEDSNASNDDDESVNGEEHT